MKLPKINPAILDHYIRHFQTGIFIAIPFVWDAIQKYQTAGHTLKFDRMTVLGVASIAVTPAIITVYGRYVKKYPHLQPEIQFVTNEATKFLEAQLSSGGSVTPPAPIPAPIPVPADTTPGTVV